MITTRRLSMTPMSVEVMQAVMAADWPRVDRSLGTPFPAQWRDDGWSWLEARVVDGVHDARSLAWGTHLVRPVGEPGPVVAEIGFHGPPDHDGWVELGYRVVAAHRRRGVAQEACRALLDWAFAEGVAGVRAAISPDNEASVRLAHTLGLLRTGARSHEELGEQLIFERPRPIQQ